MKLSILIFILLLTINYGQSQETKKFEFTIDSLAIDGINYSPTSINSDIQVGKPTYYTILETDSLALRIRVKLTKKGSQPKKLKVRIDLYESGRWYKAPLFIDLHGFTRFRIRREQCWVRTSIGYNANFPINMNCSCWKPLKGKTSHEFYLRAIGIAK